jgi:hypothetical protein
MADLVFDPQRSAETLAAVISRLLAAWSMLPPEVQQRIDVRRLQLGDELLALQDYQRSGAIIRFLSELEAMPPVATVGRDALLAGKQRPMRGGFVRLDDAQIHRLKSSLEMAPPQPTSERAAARIELEFQLHLNYAATMTIDSDAAVIVQLSPDLRPPAQRTDSIVVAFDNLHQNVPVEVALSAPGFTEQTGVWTRTIQVYSDQPSLPAVFLLRAGDQAGPRQLMVNFYHAVGAIVRQVEITAPVAKDLGPLRSFESAPSAPMAPGGPMAPVVDYFTQVAFPGQVLPGAEHPLVVRLTLEQPKESVVAGRAGVQFADARKAELIEVVATASGFTEQTQSWRRVFSVYRHTDSQPAVFLLKASDALGDQTITLDFHHRGRLVLSTSFITQVAAHLAPSPAPLRAKSGPQQIEDMVANPPPPPDVELRIVLDDQTNTLRFRLHSEIAELGYHRQELGQVKLATHPRQFIDGLFFRLSDLSAQAGEQPDEATQAILEELETIGQSLFEDLFPPDLQREYWRLKRLREAGKVRSLLVISDEPWIPWEMVKPYWFDADANEEHSDGYLAEVFQLSRWLAGRGPAPAVEVRAARLVAPALDLEYTQREREYFDRLGQRGVEVGAPLRTKSEVLQTMRRGEIKLLHLAAHGNFRPDNVNESPLQLENDELLRPSELAGARVAGLRRERPLVFLNACHSGQIDFALAGLGGWAEKMVRDIGVSAFIGTLWEVNDQLAAEFAVQFYDLLIAGKPLGEAFQAARQLIRSQDPANPTWLAYILYADPNGKVTWG